jgi:hypothetical protein
MTEETRAFLDQLDEVLVKGDKTAHEVISIITALRSMDGGSGGLKDVATVPIRRAALPKCAAKAEVGTHTVESTPIRMQFRCGHPDDANKVDTRSLTTRPASGYSYAFKQLNTAERHFVSHVHEAARALGLTIVG